MDEQQDRGDAVPAHAASLRPQPATRSSQSGIAIAGEIGLADTSVMRDAYKLVRVVKAGALGKMWEIEPYRRKILSQEAHWESARRRKVCVWLPIGNTDPASADQIFRDKVEAFWAAQRQLNKDYHADVLATAQAMSAREGQDPQGLGAVPASAVRQDAPTPTPEP